MVGKIGVMRHLQPKTILNRGAGAKDRREFYLLERCDRLI